MKQTIMKIWKISIPDPQMAKQFAEETGVDCLAIAFGTTHGVYLKEPKLDLDRVAQIRDTIKIPLVMHGGSGVSEEDYRKAIKMESVKLLLYLYEYGSRKSFKGILGRYQQAPVL